MKAIIVIDLNDTTLNEWDTDTSKCWAEIRVNTPIKGGAHGIGCVYANENVELKPMPQKKEIDENYKMNRWDNDCDMAHKCGYNCCLEDILHGEEE